MNILSSSSEVIGRGNFIAARVAAFTFCLIGGVVPVIASNLPDAPVLIQSAADTVTITKNALDGPEITHFRIIDTEGIDLSPLGEGDFVTVAEGAAGLKFTALPGATEASLTVVASLGPNPVDTGTAATTIDLAPGLGTP